MVPFEPPHPYPTSSNQTGIRLMLFDLSIYGHHPGYIQHLLEYWHREKLPHQLLIVVSPCFIEVHADVVILAKSFDADRILFIPIATAEEAALRPRANGMGRNIRNFQEWNILCRYAKKYDAEHILLMYYDTYQYPLALRLNPPCPVSGIYFRPSFHYSRFTYGKSGKVSSQRQAWDELRLRSVIANPKVSSLFSLDPYLLKFFDAGSHAEKLRHLPDPIKLRKSHPDTVKQLRDKLSIDPQRQVFLMFGALTDRKGVYKVLEAIAMLTSEVSASIALVLVGEASLENQQRIASHIQKLPDLPVQIIVHYEFVPEASVPTYFEMSDVVLAPYQNHVGMSGMTMLAAAAHKPLLSSDFGLMGEIVREHNLGITVDSASPKAIAMGMEQLLYSDSSLFDPESMDEFVRSNSAEAFARTIFNQFSMSK